MRTKQVIKTKNNSNFLKLFLLISSIIFIGLPLIASSYEKDIPKIEDSIIYTPDEDNVIYLSSIDEPFSFKSGEGIAVAFSVQEDGYYDILIGGEFFGTYTGLFDLYSDIPLGDNFPNEEEITNSIELVWLEKDEFYLVVSAPLEEWNWGKYTTLQIQPSYTNQTSNKNTYSNNLIPDIYYLSMEADEKIDAEWDDHAYQWNNMIGSIIQVTLPPNGHVNRIWGTDIYTSDSSIGSAAVHAGLITIENGGSVFIENLGPKDNFKGSKRNGIDSIEYGYYEGSYRFITESNSISDNQASISNIKIDEKIDAGWDHHAYQWNNKIGSIIQVTLPPKGYISRIWGTDIYTSDSSIGTAAVHAGLITIENGGTVLIENLGPKDNFKGSNRNGIDSIEYGYYEGSYQFINTQNSSNNTQSITTNTQPKSFNINIDESVELGWNKTAEKWQSMPGRKIEVTLPPMGSKYAAYGTDIYSANSSIGVAAVHAGLINFQQGGTVIIEILERREGFTGCAKNGVTTYNLRSFHGCFKFIK